MQIAARSGGNQALGPRAGFVTGRRLGNPFTHALDKCVLSANCVPGAVSGSGDTAETDIVSLLQGVDILEEKYTRTIPS